MQRTIKKKRDFNCFLFLLIVFLFNNKGIVKRLSLEAEKSELLQKIENAKSERDILKKEIKNLESNPETIEKVAREEFGMIRPGEKVYRVKPKEKNK